MKTLNGERVDRPAVCFYELNGLDENPLDPDPYNIFNHPSWKPLIELTRQRTDRIVMRGAMFQDVQPDPIEELSQFETWEELTSSGLSRYTRRSIQVGRRILTSLTRRDQDLSIE